MIPFLVNTAWSVKIILVTKFGFSARCLRNHLGNILAPWSRAVRVRKVKGAIIAHEEFSMQVER